MAAASLAVLSFRPCHAAGLTEEAIIADQSPGDPCQPEADEDSRGSQILGAGGKPVFIVADAIDGRLDGGVQQFGYEHDQAAAEEQEAFNGAASEPEGGGPHDQREHHLLAKGGLVFPGGAEAGE